MLTSQSFARANEFFEKIRANYLVESIALFTGVFLVFTAVTAIFFWQWVPNLNSALIGPPEDNMQDFWNVWYASVASNSKHFFFTNLIRFPEGTPLYYHSFAYPKVFSVALLSKLVGADMTSLILLQNLSLLISFPLAGAGAFYLVRYFTPNTAGALLGGFLFAFNPSHVEHVMHHAHVASIEFIPAFVLAYMLAIERKSLLFIFISIAMYALNALSCWYYLFYIAYFMAFHTLFIAIREGVIPRGWQLFTPIACLAGVIAVLSPMLIPMVRAGLGNDLVYLGGGDFYVADLFGYPAFPQFHILAPLGDRINLWLTGNQWEKTVYLGVINIAVLTYLCVVARHKDSRLLTYVLSGMAVFCIFASGDSLHVLGHRTIPMPSVALSELPFFKNVRTPSRAIVFVYLFMALGIGHAAGLAWRYRQRPEFRWGMAAITALIVLDFLPVRRLSMTPVACSVGLEVIRDDPEKDFGVLDLPKWYFPSSFYMLQQACHSRPIAQGDTSRDVVVSLRDRLETRDLQAQQRQLAAAKIKYIVINRYNMGLFFPWDHTRDGRRDQYLLTYPTIYDGPDLTVLRVY
jgi:hypothetical protein